MRITLMSIVFNVLDTLPKDMFKHNILNMYDYVDEIIIVEGATRSTSKFDGDASSFTTDGRSTDGTIELLKELEKYPKIKIIIGDGFWNGKTQMCNAASRIATGDYIWQLDSDEFYKIKDIIKIKNILQEREPDAIHFFTNNFWGGFDYCIDERESGWGNEIAWKRIFKHSGDSYWITHEPPEYMCNSRKCNDGDVVSRHETLALGIKMYHYSYVHYNQILFKSMFYNNKQYLKFWDDFTKDKNTLIFGSRVSKFEGTHPKVIQENFE